MGHTTAPALNHLMPWEGSLVSVLVMTSDSPGNHKGLAMPLYPTGHGGLLGGGLCISLHVEGSQNY